MVRIGSIVLRVQDLRRQAEFWAAALDYVPRDERSDELPAAAPEKRGRPEPLARPHHSTVHLPPPLHLDLYTDDQTGEVERLLALGATEVHWDRRPPDADYVILADPEGNRFCVVDTQPKGSG
jgi:predicted enzyme related to lactoylglutathione lyase